MAQNIINFISFSCRTKFVVGSDAWIEHRNHGFECRVCYPMKTTLAPEPTRRVRDPVTKKTKVFRVTRLTRNFGVLPNGKVVKYTHKGACKCSGCSMWKAKEAAKERAARQEQIKNRKALFQRRIALDVAAGRTKGGKLVFPPIEKGDGLTKSQRNKMFRQLGKRVRLQPSIFHPAPVFNRKQESDSAVVMPKRFTFSPERQLQMPLFGQIEVQSGRFVEYTTDDVTDTPSDNIFQRVKRNRIDLNKIKTDVANILTRASALTSSSQRIENKIDGVAARQQQQQNSANSGNNQKDYDQEFAKINRKLDAILQSTGTKSNLTVVESGFVWTDAPPMVVARAAFQNARVIVKSVTKSRHGWWIIHDTQSLSFHTVKPRSIHIDGVSGVILAEGQSHWFGVTTEQNPFAPMFFITNANGLGWTWFCAAEVDVQFFTPPSANIISLIPQYKGDTVVNVPDAGSHERILAAIQRMYPYIGVEVQSEGLKNDQHLQAPAQEITQQDISFQNEAPIVSRMEDVGRVTSDINEAWSIANVLQRPVLIASETWTTESAGEDMMGVSFPNGWLDNIPNNQQFSSFLSNFNMMRANIVFRLSVNATIMYGGVLALYFDFFDRIRTGETIAYTPMTISAMDPVYLDLAKGSTVELTVPFAAVSQYMSKSHGPYSAQFLGSVGVMAMTRLVKPETAPAVAVKLYAYLEGAQALILQEPDTSDFVEPQVEYVKALTGSSHAYVPNMSVAYPLALENSYLCNSRTDLRVERVASVKCLIGRFLWSSASGDAALATYQVHPLTCFHTSNRRYPTKLAELARHFCYWNGTLRFTIQIGASNVHSGKLLVVFRPGVASKSNAEVYSAYPHMIVDVKENHTIDFDVPFVSPTAWKPTWALSPFDNRTVEGLSTGTISIHSHDAIVSLNEEISTVDVNVFLSAAPDFQVAVPRNGTLGAGRVFTAVAQAESLIKGVVHRQPNSEDFNDLYKVFRRQQQLGSMNLVSGEWLVIPVCPYIPDLEQQPSLAQLARGWSFWKGSLKYKFQISAFSNVGLEIVHLPSHGMPPTLNGRWYHKFNPEDTRAIYQVNTGMLAASQYWYPEIDRELEVVVPYYSMYEWLHIPTSTYRTQPLPLNSVNNGLLLVRTQFLDASAAINVTVGMGEDFQFSCPTAFPSQSMMVERPGGAIVVPPAAAAPPAGGDNAAPVNPPATDVPVATSPTAPTNNSSETLVNPPEDATPAISDPVVVQGKRISTGDRDEVTVQAGFIPFQEFFSNLSKSSENFARISGVFARDMDDDSIKYFSNIVRTSVVSLMEDSLELSKDFFRSVMPEIDWKLLSSVFVAAGVAYFTHQHIDSAYQKIALSILSGVASHKLLTMFSNVFKHDPLRVQQGGSIDVQHIIHLCVSTIAYLLGALDQLPRLLKRAGDLGRSLGGVKSGMEAFSYFQQMFYEIFPSCLSGDEITALRMLRADAANIVEEAGNLNLEEMKLRCHSEAEIKEKVLHCYDGMRRISEMAVKHDLRGHTWNVLQRTMERMELYRNQVMQFKLIERYRIDPYHISLYGAPGVGKSAILNQLAEDMRAIHGWSSENLTYARSADTEYWDNYTGQTVVIYDDLGQVVMPSGSCDLTELINIKSNAPHTVHMASLAEKGRQFSSKLILSSTNSKMMNTFNGLRDVRAFHRRRNVLVEMRIKRIGGKEVPRSMEDGFPHAEFQLCDSMTGEAITGEWLNYNEFITFVACDSREYYMAQEKLLDRAMNARPTDCVAAMLQEPIETLPVIEVQGEMVETSKDRWWQDLPENMRGSLKRRWREIGEAAVANRDFSLLCSGFSMSEKLELAKAWKERKCTGLTKAQKSVYALMIKHTHLAKGGVQALVRSAEFKSVMETLRGTWSSLPKPRKRVLATCLGALGAAAAAVVLYHSHAERKKATAVVEGDYSSKRSGDYKRLVTESGIDDPRNVRAVRQRRIVTESAEDYEKWSKENPGLVPWRYEVDEKPLKWYWPVMDFKRDAEGNPQETQLWKDFLEYKAKMDKGVEPESGIDDPRNVRQVKRKDITVESSYQALDVPEHISLLSEKELEDSVDEHAQRKVVHGLMNDHTVMVEPQVLTDPACESFLESSLLDNLAMVTGGMWRLKGFIVSDRFLVVPKHFFLDGVKLEQREFAFTVQIKNQTYQQAFAWTRYYEVPNRDVAVYLLSASIQGCRSIMKRVYSRDDHRRFSPCPGYLVSKNQTDKGDMYNVLKMVSEITTLTTLQAPVEYKLGSETHRLAGYKYFLSTKAGECGSVLLTHNKMTNAKIAGFHVAGQVMLGAAYSEALVREDLEAAVAHLTRINDYKTTGSSLDTVQYLVDNGIQVQSAVNSGLLQLSENINIVGACVRDACPRPVTKTEIVPSQLQGVIDIKPTTEHSVLSPNDPRAPKGYDPLANAVSKYGVACKPFPQQRLNMVKEHFISTLSHFDGKINRRLMSLSEAINGIPGVEFADSLNMHSAEGCFWTCDRPANGHNKSWMFSEHENEHGIYRRISHKPLLEKILWRLSEAKQGRRVLSVTKETLKDERRKLTKIYCDKPSTRSFSIMPIDYNILIRQYFWDFAAMIMINRHELPCKVGINPESIEWTALFLRLKATSDRGFAGDFKNFDGQITGEMLDMICDVINAWYDDGDENAQVRKVLMGEAYDRLSLCHDAIIHIQQGLPSGFPLTVIVNSLVNWAYASLAWLELAPADKKGLHHFAEYVEGATYGDDNIYAIDPKVTHFFNLKTVGEYLSRYSITLTDENKNSWQSAPETVDLSSVSFLKRGFKESPEFSGAYLAPLEKATIEDRLLWTTKSPFNSPDELLAVNIASSMKDAFHHGPEYFRKIRETCLKGLEAIGKKHLLPPIGYHNVAYEWMSTVRDIDTIRPGTIAGQVFAC